MLRRLLIVFALVGVIAPAQAFAKVSLSRTLPADGATVGPLKKITLVFSGPVTLMSVSIKHDGKKRRLDASRSQNPMNFSIPVKAETPGEYTVQWTALTRYGGKLLAGGFSFTVSNEAE